MKRRFLAMVLTIALMIAVAPTCFATPFVSSAPAVGAPWYGTANCACNIRSNSNTESTIVGSLEDGDFIQIVGESNNGWYEVMYTYTCLTGYIRADLIDLSGYHYYVRATSDVNFRAEPSTSATRLATIFVNEAFPRRWNSGNWVHGVYATSIGYVHGDYVVGEV